MKSSTHDTPLPLHGGHYTKYLFIPVLKPVGTAQMNILVNQLFEALASPVSTVDIIYAGPAKDLAVRVSYQVEGEDPEYTDEPQ